MRLWRLACHLETLPHVAFVAVSAASPGRKTLSLSFGSLSDKARASQLGVIELGGWERGVSNRDTRLAGAQAGGRVPDPVRGSPARLFPLIVVIVADQRGLASGPKFVNADDIGVLEQIADVKRVQ